MLIIDKAEHEQALAKVRGALDPLTERYGSEYRTGYLESFIASHGLADDLAQSVEESSRIANEIRGAA
jgi:hypothetical protein